MRQWSIALACLVPGLLWLACTGCRRCQPPVGRRSHARNAHRSHVDIEIRNQLKMND
jgi:hypothetical protein